MTRARAFLVLVALVGACGGEDRVEVAPIARDAAPPVATPAAEALPKPIAARDPEPLFTLPPCRTEPRDRGQKPDQILDLVDLHEGMTVVDLGTGDGYLLCRLSRAVGARGRVVGTEVDAALVARLRARVQREALANVVIVRSPATDVGVVAPKTADRILLVNVWHHLPDRKRYAARVARALAPNGMVVIVDFEQPHPRAEHGISPARVLLELSAGGLAGTIVPDELPGQYVIVGVAAVR